MDGLIGLTKSINSRESAVRDLSILERMESNVQQKRDKEVIAQQQEQAFYEKMYAKADGMLEKDRKRINAKILQAQKQVRDHLDLAGGSRTRFMEQGGMSALNSISNSITRSDEAIRYEENKKNLAKIHELQEKGMGGLINPRDLETVEAYDKNEDGAAITYSGLMNEIEIPPSANFDYGTDIPIEKIMVHGSNAVKLKQNYAMYYPDAPEPSYLQLKEFGLKMGYGGTGSNLIRIREQMARDKAKAAAKAKASSRTGTSKDKKKHTITTAWTGAKQRVPTPTMSELIKPETEGGYGGSLIEKMKKKDQTLAKLLTDKSTLISRGRNLPEEGLDWTDVRDAASYFVPMVSDSNEASSWEDTFNNKYGLKDSYNFVPALKGKVAESLLGGSAGYKVENGKVIDFTPEETMYRMDGVKITGENKLEADKFKGAYNIEGLVTALRAKSGSDDGQDILLVDAYNDDGTIDKDETEKINKGLLGDYGGSQSEMVTVLALRNEETNDLFYYPVNMDNPDVQNSLRTDLGGYNDVTGLVKEENEYVEELANQKGLQAKEKVAITGAISTMDSQVFDNDEENAGFVKEGEEFYGPGSGGEQNRYGLMKAYYMALDYVRNGQKRTEEYPDGLPPEKRLGIESTKQVVNQKYFTKDAVDGGIDELLLDYSQGNTNDKIIGTWMANKLNQFEPGSQSYAINSELASKWKQMIELIESN